MSNSCVHCCPAPGESIHVCDSCRDAFVANSDRVYTDDYSGPRWRYGYTNRPFGISHQPKGFVLMSYQPDVRVDNGESYSRWGVIDYPFPLTDEQIYSFELFLVEVIRGHE